MLANPRIVFAPLLATQRSVTLQEITFNTGTYDESGNWREVPGQSKGADFHIISSPHESHFVALTTHEIVQSKLKYIHENPARAGIVSQPYHYPNSTNSNYAGEEGQLNCCELRKEYVGRRCNLHPGGEKSPNWITI